MSQNPFMTFNYTLELDGLILGGFSEISGLEVQTEVETIQEGGVNDLVYKLPKQTSASDLVLKRGLTTSTTLWDWYQQVIKGQVKTKNGTISLQSTRSALSNRASVRIWNFFMAYPIHWKGPAMDALHGTMAIEEFTLVTQKIQMK